MRQAGALTAGTAGLLLAKAAALLVVLILGLYGVSYAVREPPLALGDRVRPLASLPVIDGLAVVDEAASHAGGRLVPVATLPVTDDQPAGQQVASADPRTSRQVQLEDRLDRRGRDRPGTGRSG